jgi:chromosomal replication initiation ATPase DnaA
MRKAAANSQRTKCRIRFAAPPRPSRVDALEEAVAAAFAIPPAELRAPTRRSAPSALARQTAMYLAHVALGLTLTEVGRIFGRDRTTAAHACRRTESRRDDPFMDTLLVGLERVCGTLTSAHCAKEVRE